MLGTFSIRTTGNIRRGCSKASSLELATRLHGENSLEVAESHYHLGLLSIAQGRPGTEAEPHLRTALEIQQRGGGKNHRYHGEILRNLATLQALDKRLELAEETMTEAHQIFTEIYDDDHPNLANSWNQLGFIKLQKGDAVGAEPCFKETWRILEQRLAPDHPWLIATHMNLAMVARDLGDPWRCVRLLGEGLKLLGNRPDLAPRQARFQRRRDDCARRAEELDPAR